MVIALIVEALTISSIRAAVLLCNGETAVVLLVPEGTVGADHGRRQVVGHRVRPSVDGIVDDDGVAAVEGSVAGHRLHTATFSTSTGHTLTDGGNVISGHGVRHPEQRKFALVEDDGGAVAPLLAPPPTAEVPDGEEEDEGGDEADKGPVEVGLLHGVHEVVATGLRRLVHLKVILADALVVGGAAGVRPDGEAAGGVVADLSATGAAVHVEAHDALAEAAQTDLVRRPGAVVPVGAAPLLYWAQRRRRVIVVRQVHC